MKNLIIPAIKDIKNTGHDVPDSLIERSIKEAVRSRYAAPAELPYFLIKQAGT